jgi:hypothetical protein
MGNAGYCGGAINNEKRRGETGMKAVTLLRNKLLTALMLTTFLASTSGCGYFLYPERVGQTEGKVDPAVVLLDAAGLLFGILPGVVAFAVDLTTGTIYLPPGGKSAVEKHQDRLSSFGGAPVRAIGREEVRIDHNKVAEQLATLLSRSVDEGSINYYQAEKKQDRIAMVALTTVKPFEIVN